MEFQCKKAPKMYIEIYEISTGSEWIVKVHKLKVQALQYVYILI